MFYNHHNRKNSSSQNMTKMIALLLLVTPFFSPDKIKLQKAMAITKSIISLSSYIFYLF